MQFIGEQPSTDLTYSDVFLVPNRSDITSRFAVDLAPGDLTGATIPLVASNMNAVSGPRLAATMARRGGLAVLPQDLSTEQAIAAIRWVKSQPVTVDSAWLLTAETTVGAAKRILPALAGIGVVVVTTAVAESFPQEQGEERADQMSTGKLHTGGVRSDQVLGVISAERIGQAQPGRTLGELVAGNVPWIELAQVSGDQMGFERVRMAAEQAGVEMLAVRDGAQFVGTVTSNSVLRSALYQPATDASGALAVAAAVGMNGDLAARARDLVAAGATTLVVDTAHGHQQGMIAAVETVAKLDLGVPIVAGNVVTAEGARDLVHAGASIVKVGVGPGAMCTTRMMTAVGRPQFSAVLEAAEATRELGAYVWADGGVRYPRDVALALAAGAASVMIGSWFAGTVEAPGQVEQDEHGWYKSSWGMASSKAVSSRFGALSPFERAKKSLFSEGISDSKMYLDRQRPGVEDLLDYITSGVRSSCTYAGATSLAEFTAKARVGIQSGAGYDEGKALASSW